MTYWLFICVGIFLSAVQCISLQNSTERNQKVLSMFQIVKFPNDPCTATNSRNGTCFTASECTTKGGTSAGSCAQSFGVCCTFIIGCGSSSSQNCTYVETSGASAGNCKMSVCRCNTNICQLRLDFLNFVITGPSTRSTPAVTKLLNGESSGAGVQFATDATQCITDQFTVTTASSSIPVLCGTLTGDHIYVQAESDNDCNVLNFNLGAASASGTTIPTRSWQIKITQYSCDYPDLAPNGCTQYFRGTTGVVRSFNYGGSPAYHLANQKQSICVRRENCQICWYPAGGTSIDFQVSGKIPAVAIPAIAGPGFVKGSFCCGYSAAAAMVPSGYDCVMIPGASKGTVIGAMTPDSLCGRLFGTMSIAAAAIAVHASVCSRQTPFQVTFNSDNWEYVAAAIGAVTDEAAQTTSGFSLRYTQQACAATTSG